MRKSLVSGALLCVAAFAPSAIANSSVEKLTNKFIALQQAGKPRAAIELAEQVRDMVSAKYGAQHIKFAQTLNNLALLYDTSNQPARAERLYRKALEIAVPKLGARNPFVGSLHNNLAASLFSQCRFSDARESYRESVAVFRSLFGDYHNDTIMARNNLDNIERILGAGVPERRNAEIGSLRQSLKFQPASSTENPLRLPPGCVS